MNIVHGDLFELALNGNFDVIVHGCNCYRTMGSGFAKQVKAIFPAAYNADLCFMSGCSPREKLGLISGASCKRNGQVIHVVNAYTQERYGRNGVFLELDALASCFAKVKQKFSGLRIAYPLIGCDLGGGDWNQVQPIIERELINENHSLVLLNK